MIAGRAFAAPFAMFRKIAVETKSAIVTSINLTAGDAVLGIF
jgi:hypothetical protein